MRKSFLIFAAIIISGFIAGAVKAQSTLVDPGMSTHNYKHPNKAAKAKALKNDGIVVSNINTIESYSKQQNSRYVSTTPKYAPRATPLVVTRTYKKEAVDINPLISPRNYKTPNVTERSSSQDVAKIKSKADTLGYLSVD
ncbi:hypothetical protein ACFP1I_14705 [Dyadobacter subterraneus]|uniref:Uncharacterized protein n=1 Tax=Dyadobacter subterraneus TaxID=2773304 RepID=A0ABR9WBY4_9BACT|nr:hypothetical protein [Dyadobacter subterraneus]MBE9462986.1 hypothetical protein [Dyadobacter subterraneus]